MKVVALYIRNIICFLCFFQVILHLVPKEQYKKYLKLSGNLMLVFLLMRPVTEAFGMEEKLDEILSRELLEIEYGELKLQKEGMEALRTKIVNQAYEEEMRRREEMMRRAEEERKKALRPVNVFGKSLKIFAEVNGEILTSSDMQERLNAFVATTQIPVNAQNKEMIIEKVFEAAVDEKIKLQEAEKNGVKISKE